jgi:hypothetical protein
MEHAIQNLVVGIMNGGVQQLQQQQHPAEPQVIE